MFTVVRYSKKKNTVKYVRELDYITNSLPYCLHSMAFLKKHIQC